MGRVRILHKTVRREGGPLIEAIDLLFHSYEY